MYQPESVPSNTFLAHDVTDEEGHRLGTITDVIPDTATMEPKWLVVDLGKLKAAHYVPVHGSYQSAAGQIVVPFSKHVVKSAPKAGRDHVLNPSQVEMLQLHYGIAN
jgi:sporulation protein YlmC with PRC-barrel domain